MFRFASLLLLTISIAACAAPTEIVLVVDTDLPPAEVGTFWIRANGRCVTSPGDTQLPLTLGITPDGEVSGFDVLVAALEPGADASSCPSGDDLDGVIVSQRAHADFVAGERRVLFVTLERACEGLVCASDEQTCRAGACASSSVPTTSWTGVLPRLGDAVDGGMDAAVDGGSRDDAGPDDAAVGMDAGDGSVDGGPPDAGPPDSGPPDSGPPDTGCTSTWYPTTLVQDTVLINTASAGCTDCGGANSLGADTQINIGVGVGYLQFQLTGGVTPADFNSGAVRTVRLTLTRSTSCDGCARSDVLIAQAARNDWTAGTSAARSGANWCRRAAQPTATCSTAIRWSGQGGGGGFDVDGPTRSISPSLTASEVSIDLPPDGFVPFFDAASHLSVRVAPGTLGSAVFVAQSAETASRASIPRLSIEVCR